MNEERLGKEERMREEWGRMKNEFRMNEMNKRMEYPAFRTFFCVQIHNFLRGRI